jgi:hypothetical protein
MAGGPTVRLKRPERKPKFGPVSIALASEKVGLDVILRISHHISQSNFEAQAGRLAAEEELPQPQVWEEVLSFLLPKT